MTTPPTRTIVAIAVAVILIALAVGAVSYGWFDPTEIVDGNRP